MRCRGDARRHAAHFEKPSPRNHGASPRRSIKEDQCNQAIIGGARASWGETRARKRDELGCKTNRKLLVLLGLSDIHTTAYIQCSNLRQNPLTKSGAENRFRASPRMPFAAPETASAATIDPEVEPKAVRGKTARPAACKRPSTIFQRLPRRLNDLQKN